MSKQDIEKRLGFAAQGVKAEFGSNDPYMQERTVKTRKGKTSDIVAQIGQNGGGGDYIATLMIVHSDGEGQVLQSKYGYKTPESATRAAIRLFDAHVSRGGYARSGAKAKFAKPQFRTKKLHNGYIAVEVNQGNGWERYDTTHEESWNGIEEYERGYQKAYDRGLRYSGGSWRIPSTNAARSGVKGKFVRIVTTPQGRYTTNLDKNTRAPIEGGKGYVMVDPAQYITPKRVRVQGTKGEIEVRAVLDGKEIVGVSAKLVSSRPGVKAKMAKRMVVDTITSGNQKHELGYESVMQSLTAGEPPHEWFRPVVRTTNLDTGKSSEKASQPHYTEKSARDWLKNYASSVKPSTDPLYAEYASNREKISKMMTRLAQARNNPEMRQKLQAESDKLDARQREVATQLQKRKSSRPGVKAKA
jgi:hypothetical protein